MKIITKTTFLKIFLIVLTMFGCKHKEENIKIIIHKPLMNLNKIVVEIKNNSNQKILLYGTKISDSRDSCGILYITKDENRNIIHDKPPTLANPMDVPDDFKLPDGEMDKLLLDIEPPPPLSIKNTYEELSRNNYLLIAPQKSIFAIYDISWFRRYYPKKKKVIQVYYRVTLEVIEKYNIRKKNKAKNKIFIGTIKSNKLEFEKE